MKIRKIYVSSFGKLKNFSLDLKEDYNEINEKNGWGKTTLATFIKSIFYGLDNGRKALSGSERKKYKPWNSTEKFGGYIEFCWGNNEYKIERYFGDKEADDTVKLFDLKTGRESFKTENLGKRLFSIDEEGFVSSIYFSQNDLEGDVSAGLIEKFNSSYSKENDDFNKAYSRVEQTLKEYKIRGDKGKIPQLKQNIFDLGEQISVAKKARDTYISLETEVKTLKEQCENLKKNIDELSVKIENAGSAEAVRVKKERFNACKNRLNELKTELNEKESFFKNGIPTDTELEGYQNCYKELSLLKEKINSVKTALSYIKDVQTFSYNKPKVDKKAVLCLIAAVVFAVVGGIFVSDIPVLGVIMFVFAAIGLSFGTFFALKQRAPKKINDFSKQSETKKAELSEYERIAAVYENKLNAFFAGLKIEENEISSYSDNFSAIKIALSECARIKAFIKQEENTYALLSKDSDVFTDGNDIPAENLNDLKEKISRLRVEYTEKTRELAEKFSSLNRLDETASRLPDLENALIGAKESLDKAEEEFTILSKAKDFLSQANDNIIGKYRTPMEESFKKYLSLIDKKNNYGAIIDVDLNLTIKEGEKTYDPVYYSEGYRNLFEICKRFAFIDVLFTGEKPFIVLDDPFSDLDDDKVRAGIDFIQKISHEYQIIYFICHDSRSLLG